MRQTQVILTPDSSSNYEDAKLCVHVRWEGGCAVLSVCIVLEFHRENILLTLSQRGRLTSKLADIAHCKFSLHVPDLSPSLRIVSWAPAKRTQWVIEQWQQPELDSYIPPKTSSLLWDGSINKKWRCGLPNSSISLPRNVWRIMPYLQKNRCAQISFWDTCSSRLRWERHDVLKNAHSHEVLTMQWCHPAKN